MNKTPTTLIIMDGFGLSNDTVGNAVRAANTPVLDGLFAEYAHTTLQASGLDVGLPAGQMGNSEVGHTNIGGGRVVFQDLPRITRSIEDGTFFENPAYNKAMDDCLEKGSALHLYGLHSTGGVHSTLDHLYALLKMAHIKGLKRVYIHAFLDGRDTPPTSGRDFVAKTMEKCRELGVGKIATVMGRYYAMDRDKRWDRLENAYDALVYGEGVQDPDPIHAIEETLQKRRDGRICRAHRLRQGRHDLRQRFGHLLQLPPRPRPRDHARVRRPRVRRLQARVLPAHLRLQHRI